MASSIKIVPMICMIAPDRPKAKVILLIGGTATPVTKDVPNRNTSAKGNPYKNRTCVAPMVPMVAVRLCCMALRAVCAAAAIRVAIIQRVAMGRASRGK